MPTINVNQTNASETAKGIVEEATQAEVNAGTDTGGTGAKVFIAPSKLPAGVRLTPLTGFSVGANSTILATDTVAGAFAKTQGQINARATLSSPTFTGTPNAPTAAQGNNSTQIATTAYTDTAVANAVTGLLDLKGSTDASSNPNYPAASKGDAYYISVAGKIGGASGKSVDIGDTYIALLDNAGGTEAAVGTSWFVLEHNLAGALLSANNLSDLANAGTARTNLGLGTIATLAAPSGSVVGTSDTQTLTNKRITARTSTEVSSATPTINTDNVDYHSITALAVAITSFTTNLSGTPTDAQTLWISITDNGTARAIAWGASFESSGNVTLPTTTVISTRLDVGFIWNAATSRWRCVGKA